MKASLNWETIPCGDILVRWDMIEVFLGRPHNGKASDDDRLYKALCKDRAIPKWMVDAEGYGYVDEIGWYMEKPRESPLEES